MVQDGLPSAALTRVKSMLSSQAGPSVWFNIKKLLIDLNVANTKSIGSFVRMASTSYSPHLSASALGSRCNVNVTGSIELFGEQYVQQSKEDKSCIMKSIITTYPDFQSLSKGIRRMLVASESFFFLEANSRVQKPRNGEATTGATPSPNRRTNPGGPLSAFGYEWKN